MHGSIRVHDGIRYRIQLNRSIDIIQCGERRLEESLPLHPPYRRSPLSCKDTSKTVRSWLKTRAAAAGRCSTSTSPPPTSSTTQRTCVSLFTSDRSQGTHHRCAAPKSQRHSEGRDSQLARFSIADKEAGMIIIRIGSSFNAFSYFPPPLNAFDRRWCS